MHQEQFEKQLAMEILEIALTFSVNPNETPVEKSGSGTCSLEMDLRTVRGRGRGERVYITPTLKWRQVECACLLALRNSVSRLTSNEIEGWKMNKSITSCPPMNASLKRMHVSYQ
ncbi:hypothetical protein HNY73_001103 [Argiope bruennichi]|uniref:Uncharacterized protein n=1 Tax=Argiope bruennichi TaxID=94029 RepID=A0A8T0G1B6_ARGBR|nr:hypothetical protein HNY73_001103 [Argiope bruennichi]